MDINILNLENCNLKKLVLLLVSGYTLMSNNALSSTPIGVNVSKDKFLLVCKVEGLKKNSYNEKRICDLAYKALKNRSVESIQVYAKNKNTIRYNEFNVIFVNGRVLKSFQKDKILVALSIKNKYLENNMPPRIGETFELETDGGNVIETGYNDKIMTTMFARIGL